MERDVSRRTNGANKIQEPANRIETTVGELIEAITQVAIEAGRSEAEGYKLASITLGSILGRRRARARFTERALH